MNSPDSHLTSKCEKLIMSCKFILILLFSSLFLSSLSLSLSSFSSSFTSSVSALGCETPAPNSSYYSISMSRGKPARLQVDPDSIPDDDRPPQSGHTFNIWYLKWAGGDLTTRNYVQLKFRVNIKRDSGYTKGVENKSPICLFFARGCCYRGKKCPYIHRLPSESEYRIPTQDCFGRDKTPDYKDDMSGVGLLSRPNRTIYVSGIHVNDHIDDVLSANFLEFGSIDKIRVLYGKGCAFISYRLESEAQFAKEAMDSQTLTGNDVLTVRWANEDPNPQAQDQTKRFLEEEAMNTVKALLSKRTKLDGKSNKGLDEKHEKDTRKLLEETVDKETVEDSSSGGSVSAILDASRVSALRKIKLGGVKNREQKTGENGAGKDKSNIERKAEAETDPKGENEKDSIHKCEQNSPLQPSMSLLAGYSSEEE